MIKSEVAYFFSELWMHTNSKFAIDPKFCHFGEVLLRNLAKIVMFYEGRSINSCDSKVNSV